MFLDSCVVDIFQYPRLVPEAADKHITKLLA